MKAPGNTSPGRPRPIIAFFVAGLCAAVMVAVAFAAGLLVDFELRFGDYLAVLNGRQVDDNRVVTVVFSDDSLGRLGRWPLPREVEARLIDRLSAAGARIIVFDVLFSEPGDDNGDVALTEAVRRSGRVVLPALARLTPASKTAPVADSIDRPYGGLVESAFSIGVANVLPDADGVVRAMPLYVTDGFSSTPSLAAAAVSAYTGRPFRVAEDGAVFLGDERLPTDRWGRLTVGYASPRGQPGDVDAADVLAGTVDRDKLADRLVVVGPIAAGVGDRWLTPFSILDRLSVPGLRIQAETMRTIINGDRLRTVGVTQGTAIVLGLGLLAGLWTSLSSGQATAAAGAATIGLTYAGLTLWAFHGGLALPTFGPLLSVVAATGATVLLRWRTEERERRRVDVLFGRFVSEEVAATLVRSAGRVELGGEEVELTVLFADLRGFTGLAERLLPAPLVGVLDRYLGAMAEGVFAHGGTLDKYTGDGIMAFFNAPVRQPDHCRRGVQAALEIRRRVEAVRQGLDLPMEPPGVGVGLCTGRAVVGNVGTPRRLEYTAVGDQVNLASRLKDLAGAGEILAGRATVDGAGVAFAWQERGSVEVRGRSGMVEVYRLLTQAPIDPAPVSRGERRRARTHRKPPNRR